IAAILASVDTLKNSTIRLSDQQRTDILQELDDASTRLNRQVENLLNMSRLESGLLQPRTDWCDVTELVYQVLEKLPPHPQSIQVEASETLPLFKIDQGLLDQVIFNLLHNAVAYTPEQANIRVTITTIDELLEICIRDNGNGIPIDDEPRLFQKFYRANGTPTGGLGLGLSIVKGFVDALQGKIQYQRLQPTGAQFCIQIPGETSYLCTLKNE
ncbi:MAG TPA: ATP-binding protein, partial [Ferruginibacter sp.]|nr:ATP-binding protein [Ferruginibacter sp.]